MSQRLIARNPDLQRLRDEGYDIVVSSSNYLLVRDVPYVDAQRQVRRGTLVSRLELAGEAAVAPQDHVVFFVGEYPCDNKGAEIAALRHQSGAQTLDVDLVVQHSFSNKPPGGYPGYYEKMRTYATLIAAPAESIDPDATPRTFPVVELDEDESVFRYADTATSRAGIGAAARKLEGDRVAIVGVGGTGAYVLDLLAKTPVREIHLFDGDAFLNHNAFRAPGAASADELRGKPTKVAYLQNIYDKMRRGVIAHPGFVTAANVVDLKGFDFVFLSLDGGEDKRLIVRNLEEWGVPFIDVGMGLQLVDDRLTGVLTVTTSTPAKRDHAGRRISFVDGGRNDAYAQNIQIAELNAFNAALAVIRWKKLKGFYHDHEREHFAAYTIDGNRLVSEEQLS